MHTLMVGVCGVSVCLCYFLLFPFWTRRELWPLQAPAWVWQPYLQVWWCARRAAGIWPPSAVTLEPKGFGIGTGTTVPLLHSWHRTLPDVLPSDPCLDMCGSEYFPALSGKWIKWVRWGNNSNVPSLYLADPELFWSGLSLQKACRRGSC